MKYPKFEEGDLVKIVCLLDDMTSRELIGQRSQIMEIDELPNGDYNYYLTNNTYVHEEELEFDIPGEIMQRMLD